jgi:hypothetical protein
VFEGSEGLVMEFRGQYKVILTVTAIHQCFSLCIERSDLDVAIEKAVPTDRVLAQPFVAARRT